MFRSITQIITARLASQMIAALAGISLLTAAAAGIPAYLLIQGELERQAWVQVSNAQRVTTSLLNDRQARLTGLAEQTAGDENLLSDLNAGDHARIDHLLDGIRRNAGLAFISLRDAHGVVIAGDAPEDVPDQSGSAYWVSAGDRPGAFLVAVQPVSGGVKGTLLLGLPLDDDFAQVLAGETGLAQSVITTSGPLASSLGDASHTDALSPALDEVMAAGRVGQTSLTINGQPYDAALIPLKDADQETVAVIETALPMAGAVAARDHALRILLLSALGAMAASGLLAVILARRLAAPLEKLTVMAAAISQGDLTQPAPRLSRPAEIAALATALEKSRLSLRHSLDELSRAKAWSENLIGSISEGVVTFDVSGVITFFSQGAERILGLSRTEALGKHIDAIFQLEKTAIPFSEHIPPRGGSVQIHVARRDGRDLSLAITGERLTPPDSDSIQVVLVLRDVTEEQAIRDLQSHFLANITHEFRTPLAAINASLELLMDETRWAPHSGISVLLGSIYLSVLNLQTLIDNLLESTSIEAGRFMVRRHPAELDQVLVAAIRMVQPVLARRGQTLSLSEPVSLPDISLDRTRLTQVLVNLLSNASKYSPAKSAIDLAVEMGDNQIRLSISDRGPGIPQTERSNLFRQFVRLDLPGEEQVGTGLGLSVAKAIVDRHGGHIGVDERAGGGSTFWFTLPLQT